MQLMLSRKVVFAITLWMLVMIAILAVLDSIGVTVPHTPLAQAIAAITLLSFVMTVLAWTVFAISAYREPKPKPKTPHEIALHQDALENREKIIKASAIMLAIILGIALVIFYLIYFVHIELFFTLTPTTTP